MGSNSRCLYKKQTHLQPCQTMLTHVLSFLFLLISYVNYTIGPNSNLRHIRNCTKALKNPEHHWDRNLVVCTTNRRFNSWA